MVWLKTHFLSDAAKGITASLLKKREGPYQVRNIISKNVYDLKNEISGALVNKVHANELSPYLPPFSQQNGEVQPSKSTTRSSSPSQKQQTDEPILFSTANVSSRNYSMERISSPAETKESRNLGQNPKTY